MLDVTVGLAPRFAKLREEIVMGVLPGKLAELELEARSKLWERRRKEPVRAAVGAAHRFFLCCGIWLKLMLI